MSCGINVAIPEKDFVLEITRPFAFLPRMVQGKIIWLKRFYRLYVGTPLYADDFELFVVKYDYLDRVSCERKLLEIEGKEWC